MRSEELKKAWEETDKSPFLGILRTAKPENLAEALEGRQDFWKKAFDGGSKKRVLICSDERVLPEPGEFKIGVAGQLVLGSEEDRNKFIAANKGKIGTVRSHSGCGAAGIAWDKLSDAEKHSFLENNRPENVGAMSPADYYGYFHSRELAGKLEARFEHTPFGGMRGSEGFHDARIIFWSSDSTFDPAELVDGFMPPHFLANGLAYGLSEEYCKKEVEILSGIALGHHGFADLFTQDNPFYAVSVGKNANELNETAKVSLKDFGNRVNYKYYQS